MRNLIVHIVLFFTANSLFAQSLTLSERYWIDDPKKLHSSYKNDFDLMHDSLFQNDGKIKYKFAPSLIASYDSKTFKTTSGIQFLAYKQFSEKLNLKLYNDLAYTNAQLSPYYSVLQPKAFFYFPVKDNHAIYNDLRGRLSFKASKFFQLETGMDKHFFGEGSRSLLMGNQGVSSPFVMMKTKLWKLEYINLHQIWRENQPGHYLPKANATHYLNFNHKNKISFGIFESVVHIIKDTLYNRGFEVEYLNPLIFYRPQEYSLGSSDNVVLGLNGFITWKKNQLYGQILLDDINIAEIKAKSKWWSNKYGMQAGFKTWFNLANTSVFFRTELSFTTPYTYAAANNNLNYSNQGQAMAHPLGGNFVESFSEFAFDHKSWNVHTWVQFYMKGNDPINDTASYGGDIYKSYNLRPFGDTGYYFGMGEKTYQLQLGTKISKTITKNKFTLFVEPRLFLVKHTPKIVPDVFVTLGFHYNFMADKRNY